MRIAKKYFHLKSNAVCNSSAKNMAPFLSSQIKMSDVICIGVCGVRVCDYSYINTVSHLFVHNTINAKLQHTIIQRFSKSYLLHYWPTNQCSSFE